jgi:hypothetical protein
MFASSARRLLAPGLAVLVLCSLAASAQAFARSTPLDLDTLSGAQAESMMEHGRRHGHWPDVEHSRRRLGRDGSPRARGARLPGS